MKTLILTEKPSVAMDFAKALGVQGKHDGYIEDRAYIITWAVGHLVELLAPDDYDPRWKSWRLDTLPIIPEEFRYKPISKTEKQLKIIRRLLSRKTVGDIVIATDAGREGEVIARTILLFSKFDEIGRIRRFWTSQALTEQVVKEGMQNLRPASDYDRLWDAGQARQVADWLVGMSCTRAATLVSRRAAGKRPETKKNNDLFSVGRVQTAVLAFIVDRKRERDNFKPEPYWTLRAFFVNEKGDWWGTWFKKEQTRFDKEAEARQVLQQITGQTGKVSSVKKQKKRHPPPFLYSLTDLQQEANKKFGLSAKATLGIAQNLYEKKKCLSYPRTDAKVLGTKNAGMAKKLVEKLSDAYPVPFAGVRHELIRASNKRVFNDARLTDHHALIPLAPLPAKATKDEQKIYYLVLKRFAAAFHPDCEFEQTEIITAVAKERFRTRGKRILEPGWQAVYAEDKPKKKASGREEEPENLPPLVRGDPARVREGKLEKKMTQPPPQYSEALLLKDMTNPGRYVSEDDLKKIFRGDVGLGTQATRAQIIETLLARQYVVREKKLLKATEKGCQLVDTLRRFRQARILTSPQETARWERQLDQIARGEGADEDFLNSIRQLVENMVEEFKTGPQALGPCPVCGGDVIRGKRDFGCSNWRKQDGGCRFVIRSQISGRGISPQNISELLIRKQAGPLSGFVSEDGRPFPGLLKLVETDGQWGVQLEESHEPPKESPASETFGTCPACGGDVVETAKAYGCANWREEDGGCKFVIWKHIAKKLITPEMARELMQKGKIGPLEGFVSKKETLFSASLKLVQQDDQWAVRFEFDDAPSDSPAPSEKTVIGKCPACGGDVVEGKKGYGCANWREEDGRCKFVIWKQMAQREISESVAAQLLENGITDILFGFISRKGSAFSARLKLETNSSGVAKVVFDFPDRA